MMTQMTTLYLPEPASEYDQLILDVYMQVASDDMEFYMYTDRSENKKPFILMTPCIDEVMAQIDAYYASEVAEEARLMLLRDKPDADDAEIEDVISDATTSYYEEQSYTYHSDEEYVMEILSINNLCYTQDVDIHRIGGRQLMADCVFWGSPQFNLLDFDSSLHDNVGANIMIMSEVYDNN